MPKLRVPLLVLLLAPLLVLSACGSGDVGPKPTYPSETPALWNPCDGLKLGFVKQTFGASFTKQSGTPTKPECRFVPKKGGPAVNANYQMFGGSLDEFFTAMDVPTDADVRTPKVAASDGVRIVVSAEKDQLYVTGFVQNGFLFQVVNVVDPAPYDKETVVQGVGAVLGQLSEHAADKGAGQESE
ncbi:MAG: hypothetical protein L0H31_07275 [Nocardioidaceae bacterium]|nr:hypothetical protein [Nocardioidaceae bacterium]